MNDLGTLLLEHAAARQAAALFDLPHRGRLRVTGEDRVSFLHNLLSNDVAGLAGGEGRHALLLTEVSKVVADLLVLRAEDDVVLDLDVAVAARAKEHLEKHLVADDVEIEDWSGVESTLGLVGPLAGHVLRAAGIELPGAALLSHGSGVIDGVRVRVVATAWTGRVGFDLHIAASDRETLRHVLLDARAAAGIVEAGFGTFDALRLEAGTPLLGVDVDESNLALEAGLDDAISFRKGCYLGQETIERVAARGHVNKKRVGLRLSGELAPGRGAAIRRAGADVGRVTSAAWSPALHAPIAMGYVRREAFEPGTELEVEIDGGLVAAVVALLPFVGRD